MLNTSSELKNLNLDGFVPSQFSPYSLFQANEFFTEIASMNLNKEDSLRLLLSKLYRCNVENF